MAIQENEDKGFTKFYVMEEEYRELLEGIMNSLSIIASLSGNPVPVKDRQGLPEKLLKRAYAIACSESTWMKKHSETLLAILEKAVSSGNVEVESLVKGVISSAQGKKPSERFVKSMVSKLTSMGILERHYAVREGKRVYSVSLSSSLGSGALLQRINDLVKELQSGLSF